MNSNGKKGGMPMICNCTLAGTRACGGCSGNTFYRQGNLTADPYPPGTKFRVMDGELYRIVPDLPASLRGDNYPPKIPFSNKIAEGSINGGVF